MVIKIACIPLFRFFTMKFIFVLANRFGLSLCMQLLTCLFIKSAMYYRLTPTLMFFILFSAKLSPFLGAGPLWFVRMDTSSCSENWWTNLLYINNFIPENLAEVGYLSNRI